MEINIEKIENINLLSKYYSEDVLKHNMEHGTITPYMVLKYQKNLSNEFIFDYILNKKYMKFKKDFDITLNKIISIYPDFGKFNIKAHLELINKCK